MRPLLLGAAGLAALALCPTLAAAAEPDAGARIENAFHGALQDRSHASPAEALFVEKCGMCHRQMGMGTVILARRMAPAKAQLEKRDDLTTAYVSFVARTGLGNMPRIQRGEVSDAQLAVIAAYLAKGRQK